MVNCILQDTSAVRMHGIRSGNSFYECGKLHVHLWPRRLKKVVKTFHGHSEENVILDSLSCSYRQTSSGLYEDEVVIIWGHDN